jgi:TRAP-type C4-dicarboxylate transport system substrate-binding protein
VKRLLILTVALVLMVGTILVGCSGNGEQANNTTSNGNAGNNQVQTIEWRMASFVPAVDVFSVPVTNWGKAMEEQTGGRFKLFSYFADSLVKSQGLLDAVEAGTTDVSMCTLSAWSERVPFQAPFGMMGTPAENSPHTAQIVMHMYDWVQQNYPQYMDKFFGKTDVMWLNCPGPRNLIISNKPIKTMADMKGLKLTATSAEDIQGFKLLGASTVPLFTGDMYMGLQTGVIDAIHLEYNQAWLWRLFEVSKYRIENTVKKGSCYPTLYNPDSYAKLPSDIKAVFDASFDPLPSSVAYCTEWEAWKAAHKIVLENYWDKHGYPADTYHYVLPDDESKLWNDTVKPVIQGWIDRTNNVGLPGTEFWAEAVRYADETRAQSAADLANVLPGDVAQVQADEAASGVNAGIQ